MLKALLHPVRLRTQDRDVLLNTALWLTKMHGASIRPRVPKLLSKRKQPSPLRCWDRDNPDTVFHWADAEFAKIREAMGLSDWAVQLLPDAAQAARFDQRLVGNLQSRSWDIAAFPNYYVDNYGRPLIYYDPRSCAAPGAFQMHIIPSLASAKLLSSGTGELAQFAPSAPPIADMCVHLGQGFTALAYYEAGSSAPSPDTLDPILTATVLSLMGHRMTPEQIIASYGPHMSKRSRRRIWPIYQALIKARDGVDLLQIMTDRRKMEAAKSYAITRSEPAEHSRLHQARS